MRVAQTIEDTEPGNTQKNIQFQVQNRTATLRGAPFAGFDKGKIAAVELVLLTLLPVPVRPTVNGEYGLFT